MAWAVTACAAAGCPAKGRVASGFTGAPSNAKPGAANGVAPSISANMIRLDVRIALFLVRTARMGHSPVHRRPNLLGIFPQRTRRVISLSRRPLGFTIGKFGVGQFHVKTTDLGVDLDDVTILQQRDRAADRRLRPDMADAETTGGAGEPAVGDQGDLAAHPLPGQSRRGREHLPHPGTTARPLVADHDDLALLVGLLLDRLEGVFLAIETARRTGKFQLRHARDFHDRTLWSEITLQPDNASRDGDRVVGGPP